MKELRTGITICEVSNGTSKEIIVLENYKPSSPYNKPLPENQIKTLIDDN